MTNFNITELDMSNITLESIRFIFHVGVIGILSNIMNNKDLLDLDLLRSLVFIIISVILYNLVFKKLLEPIITNMKDIKKKNKIN